ncbi:hypothetical protein MSG28_010864 [Choristoneura fumiferana]|uniref:Uncharacterized protein n=2 Tax=Choristoneura fumiferana TaxID=7141 RepID=A0ACC0KPR1_CHOFU|nr:hypothetical protein MSG28_010864 [Choristoneura fumiferana]
MTQLKQIDCFSMNIKFWKVLAIWPSSNMHRFYKYYYKVFVAFFVFLCNFLFTINFYYLPRHLDLFVEEMIFYFTELAVTSKVLTFILMHDKIVMILNTLESKMFQPETEEGLKIIDDAKKFIVRYWKIVAVISVTSNLTHILSPFITHLFLPVKLNLPVCSYSFLSENTTQAFIYPLYWYQALSMHFHMLCNVNIDTFILGVLILAISQLDILDGKLRRVTEKELNTGERKVVGEVPTVVAVAYDEAMMKLKQSIVHFDELGKYIYLASTVAIFYIPGHLYVYHDHSNIGSMLSQLLSSAVYNCNWTAKSRYFKSSLRLFAERANKPLSITAGKMFPLSLTTFTSTLGKEKSEIKRKKAK